MSTFLTTLFRRAPQASENTPRFPYNIQNNPYQCKRQWPPDFTELSQKHQFQLERRYRRRSKLKYARPNWNKGVQLAQWGAILFVVTYGVFYLRVEDVVPKRAGEEGGGTVFDGFRTWYGGQVDGLKGSRGRPEVEASETQKG